MTDYKDLLEKVYQLSEQGRTDDSLDELINTVDDRLRAGHFSEVEDIITVTDWSRLHPDLAYAFYILVRKAPVQNKDVIFDHLSEECREDL